MGKTRCFFCSLREMREIYRYFVLKEYEDGENREVEKGFASSFIFAAAGLTFSYSFWCLFRFRLEEGGGGITCTSVNGDLCSCASNLVCQLLLQATPLGFFFISLHFFSFFLATLSPTCATLSLLWNRSKPHMDFLPRSEIN